MRTIPKRQPMEVVKDPVYTDSMTLARVCHIDVDNEEIILEFYIDDNNNRQYIKISFGLYNFLKLGDIIFYKARKVKNDKDDYRITKSKNKLWESKWAKNLDKKVNKLENFIISKNQYVVLNKFFKNIKKIENISQKQSIVINDLVSLMRK